jgi:hypothetical protein
MLLERYFVDVISICNQATIIQGNYLLQWKCGSFNLSRIVRTNIEIFREERILSQYYTIEIPLEFLACCSVLQISHLPGPKQHEPVQLHKLEFHLSVCLSNYHLSENSIYPTTSVSLESPDWPREESPFQGNSGLAPGSIRLTVLC